MKITTCADCPHYMNNGKQASAGRYYCGKDWLPSSGTPFKRLKMLPMRNGDNGKIVPNMTEPPEFCQMPKLADGGREYIYA